MLKEIWRDIIDFEDRYQISNRGRVRSLLTNMILKEGDDGRGYKKLTLSGVVAGFRYSHIK